MEDNNNKENRMFIKTRVLVSVSRIIGHNIPLGAISRMSQSNCPITLLMKGNLLGIYESIPFTVLPIDFDRFYRSI